MGLEMDPLWDPNMDPKSSDILVTSEGCQILDLTRSGPDLDRSPDVTQLGTTGSDRRRVTSRV